MRATPLLLLLLIGGCGGRSCGGSPAVESTAPDAAAPARTLAAQASEIENGTHADACEVRVAARRRKVCEAVDRAWPQIERRGAALAEAPPFTRARLGPTYVRIRAAAAPSASGVVARDRSWDAMDASLTSLASLASERDEADERWVSLAREARALLAFDYARIVGGSWRDTPLAALPSQRVAANPAVTRDGDRLVVPLDAGPFDASREELARIVETSWTGGQLAVRVRWTTQATEPLAYKLVFEDGAGEPSYVSVKRRAIVLKPDVRAHAIAHEVGHVLGFADRYAKRWDPARCVYVDEQEPGDIMSDPDGPVTTEEWSLLAAAYPQ